jgi:hypothetical protein
MVKVVAKASVVKLNKREMRKQYGCTERRDVIRP